MELKNKTHYVVEVSGRDTNPIHAGIYYYHCEGSCLNIYFNESYENEAQYKQPKDFYYFNLVREINMSIPHDFTLPDDINKDQHDRT